jgi:hypothetical protein
VKYRIATAFACVALAAFCLTTGSVGAQGGKGDKVKPINTWKGSVDDENLMRMSPKSGVITDEKEFQTLWNAWKLGDKVPAIDFKKDLVVLGVTRGSRLNVNPQVQDGNLRVMAISTRDLRDGFRYEIHQISREGIKKVEGNDLK